MADELNKNLENAGKAVNNVGKQLKDALDLQKQMEKSVSSYLSAVKKIGEQKRSIAKTEKLLAKAELKLAKERVNLSNTEKKNQEDLIAYYRQKNKEARIQVEELAKAVSGANA